MDPQGRLQEPGYAVDNGSQQSDDIREERTQPRFALLLRSAKLVGPSGEYLCIVRDVSESGVKLKLFHEIPADETFELEMVTGERFAIQYVWQKDNEAGFSFSNPVDILTFISENGSFPKRPIRLRMGYEVRLVIDGDEVPAIVHDLSRQGAGIETGHMLAIGQKLRIKATQLPAFDATVCWRDHPSYGLVFAQLMGLEDLAQRTYRINQNHPRVTFGDLTPG